MALIYIIMRMPSGAGKINLLSRNFNFALKTCAQKYGGQCPPYLINILAKLCSLCTTFKTIMKCSFNFIGFFFASSVMNYYLFITIYNPFNRSKKFGSTQMLSWSVYQR